MAFDWTVLRPVAVTVDTSRIASVAIALRRGGAQAKAKLGAVVRKWGAIVHENARENLSGRVLHVRSGRLIGSWAHAMLDSLTWRSETDVGYGALWETGFTAKPGRFPVRIGGIRRGKIEWRWTWGGWRKPRPWLGPAVEAIADGFTADLNRAAIDLILGRA